MLSNIFNYCVIEYNLDMDRSDILVSPPNSDDDNIITFDATSAYEVGQEFHEMIWWHQF